tara:strand:- start:4433 stop:4552 length:120 start_codon:yes stop_codon:yes gene_type:complete
MSTRSSIHENFVRYATGVQTNVIKLDVDSAENDSAIDLS